MHDDNLPAGLPEEPPSEHAEPARESAPSADSVPVAPIPGDPIEYAASVPLQPKPPAPTLPEDLRISWSWVHLLLFLVFAVASFVVVQTALAIYYAPPQMQHLTQKQVQEYFLSKPQFLFGSNVLWYATIFLFLYVTLAVLRELPFWRSLGWRPLKPNPKTGKTGPWIFFLLGCGLSILVAIAGSQVHSNENIPIQELFKNRTNAFLLMGMAVLIAPLFEETIFRGYLYPLFAKSFGVLPSVLLTGLLFGLLHGSQLGWTWGIVLLLIVVGVVLTYVRARTGTVFASFLVHLGYNSMIAVTSIVSTHGFTKLTP
ncbi:MAG TPA: CPBP family glutamic-type intramembrane protease [Candidatus Acidoferrum sp.]|jgi:hypothetical protein